MKAWITKYALTRGIYEENLEVCGKNDDAHNTVRFFPVFYKSGDWHTSKEEAIVKANEMRLRKISSLKRQIEKLENMKFE